MKTPSGHSMFTSCISELVLETREVVICSVVSVDFDSSVSMCCYQTYARSCLLRVPFSCALCSFFLILGRSSGSWESKKVKV